MSKKMIDENNPALAFMTIEEDPQEEIIKAPKAHKKTTTARKPAQEIRSYRVNLALTSSLGEKLKARAWRERRSVNNLVEAILEQYLND